MQDIPPLSDGVIELTQFRVMDIDHHVAGDDEESIHRLNDGHPSAIETTTAWVERNLDWWRTNGPRRLFAIRSAATGLLAGMVEANLDSDSCGLLPGEVNLSYQVYPQARGQGYAARAVNLACTFLSDIEGAAMAVLRIEDDNAASLRVAAASGFRDYGWIVTPQGYRLRQFRRVLPRPPNC